MSTTVSGLPSMIFPDRSRVAVISFEQNRTEDLGRASAQLGVVDACLVDRYQGRLDLFAALLALRNRALETVQERPWRAAIAKSADRRRRRPRQSFHRPPSPRQGNVRDRIAVRRSRSHPAHPTLWSRVRHSWSSGWIWSFRRPAMQLQRDRERPPATESTFPSPDAGPGRTSPGPDR